MCKILIYSHCFIFSGSEMMIENILKSETVAKDYSLSFYYAYNKRYNDEVRRRFHGYKNVNPLKILSAFDKWGYQAKMNQQKKNFKLFYIWFRYLTARLLQQTGLYDLYNVWILYQLFSKEFPDILFINNGGYPGARSCRMAVISARMARINKVIFAVHNLAAPQHGIVDKWLDNYISKNINLFVTPAKVACRQLVKMRSITEAKCMAIPNTLSAEIEGRVNSLSGTLKQEFQIDNVKIILGAVGLLTYRKGFHILLEAVKILKTKNIRLFKLFIFGEGEERLFLEEKINAYGIEDTVVLAGYKTSIQKYMADFDVLICPSIANEVFPYVILEAMLLAKPVIGANIAAIPEQIIDKYNGLIVPPGNPEILAEAIELIVTDDALRIEMGENGFKRYKENFDNARIMQRYKQLFASIINT